MELSRNEPGAEIMSFLQQYIERLVPTQPAPANLIGNCPYIIYPTSPNPKIEATRC